MIHNPWGTYRHFVPDATQKDVVQWDDGSWPGDLPKKDRANALSGAGSVDTATAWPSKTSRTKNLIIELAVSLQVAERYGTIVAQVPPGEHIGHNDYWIAAIALTHDLVLITNDPDFERVPGLQKENWLT